MSDQDKDFAKCAWRLIPFMMSLHLVAYIDRTNIGIAALTMDMELGLSPRVLVLARGCFLSVIRYLWDCGEIDGANTPIACAIAVSAISGYRSFRPQTCCF